MGKIFSSLAWRVKRNLNVENRAMRVLDREKVAAPMYESDVKYVQRLREERPELQQQVVLNDPELLKRLQSVYVTSRSRPAEVERVSDPMELERVSDPVEETTLKPGATKELPADRGTHDVPMYGYREPKRATYGRVTFRSVMTMLEEHQMDRTVNSAQSLALRYKIDEQVCSDILKHFFIMQSATGEEIAQAEGKPVEDDASALLKMLQERNSKSEKGQ